MKINEIQSSIGRLKKENDICILAHSYQSQDIIETADFTGDSYALSMKAKEVKEKTGGSCGSGKCGAEMKKEANNDIENTSFYIIC